MAYRILHISDLHAGPPFDQAVAAVLVRQAPAIQADLVVISGDFVQRADFVAQWRAAQALREALPGPQLVVPGNHDVPLYNLLLRFFNPLGRYRRYISNELNPVFELPGLVVVGAVTAQGLSFESGWLGRRQAATLQRILSSYGPEVYKLVVWHHPVMSPTGTRKNRIMRGNKKAIRLLDACGVDMLLCGHYHVSCVGTTLDVVRGLDRGTIICQSGTTTSQRGYGRERGKNTCNLIEIGVQTVTIKPLLFNPLVGRFEHTSAHVFPRRVAAPSPLSASVTPKLTPL
ncbi:metallophosphoesterase family protein [Candidatus Viridilinea mediisalina]|uniref:Metallophosphoesterase n=1 Tax=Candidatus Viridilinea mediisalina TaxID=2024553 RepID=A0A2A6RFT5_9CHLR|nr:metallophosphoesterase family protein [Candidatus Viridilinea mediisalina]PDW01882.1 metallophosphoesterase [Candidatus Viridilinea mediisalina]